MAPSSPLTAAQLERFEARLQRERRRLLGLTDSPPDADTPGLADPSDPADLRRQKGYPLLGHKSFLGRFLGEGA